MVPNWVITRLRRRPSYEQNARLTVNQARELRVGLKPRLPLFVLIHDHGSQSVCDVGVDLGLRQLTQVVRVGLGSDLGEDPIGFLDEVMVNDISFRATQDCRHGG